MNICTTGLSNCTVLYILLHIPKISKQYLKLNEKKLPVYSYFVKKQHYEAIS